MVANDFITLWLDGDIPVTRYAEALTRLNSLIQSLNNDVAPDVKMRWMVSNLAASSAITEARGIPDQEENLPAVERVAAAYVEIGQGITHNRAVPYSPKSIEAGRRLASLVNGEITTMRFENVIEDVTVKLDTSGQLAEANTIITQGAVEGVVETLSRRGGLRFMLYDLRNDKAVSCYLTEGQQDQMRESWGRIVVVEGLVKRDAETGRPLTVRQVRRVDVLPEYEKGAYRRAVGVLERRPDEPRAEDLIRRIRDAE